MCVRVCVRACAVMVIRHSRSSQLILLTTMAVALVKKSGSCMTVGSWIFLISIASRMMVRRHCLAGAIITLPHLPAIYSAFTCCYFLMLCVYVYD